jgi:hypothetical protein
MRKKKKKKKKTKKKGFFVVLYRPLKKLADLNDESYVFCIMHRCGAAQ